MQIEIDGKKYLLKVKETHMTPDKEFVDSCIPLEQWSEVFRKKAISSIYYIEESLSEIIGTPINLTVNYPEIKKPLLDLNGSIGRLPSNLIIELIDDRSGD